MRLGIVMGFFALIWIVLLSKIYYLSIRSNDYYSDLSMRNAYKSEIIYPARGIIYDRNGVALAANTIGFSIDMAPNLITKKLGNKPLLDLVQNLQTVIPEINATTIIKRYGEENAAYNHDFIRVVDFLPYEKVLPLYTKLSQNPLLKINASTKRNYPYDKLASHMVGYVAKASKADEERDPSAKILKFVGKAGLEKYYNKLLVGTPSVRTILTNAYNREVAEINKTDASHNQDLRLALDVRLQKIADEAFVGQSGAVVVMDVHTGEMLVAGSYPDFNISSFAQGFSTTEWNTLINDLKHPLTNKLTKGLYPPGSTIKPGMALGFLRSGKITPDWGVQDIGYVTLGGRKFRDWKKDGHGYVSMKKGIQVSCDTYFYTGGSLVGIEVLSDIMKYLGLGAKTGIDLPEESYGVVPDPAWKKKRLKQSWYAGDTINTVIGQGNFLATPLQIANYTSFLASGILREPRLAISIGKNPIPSQIRGRFTPQEEEFAKTVRAGMYDVCNEPGGTAYRTLSNLPIKVAGKTGTAQVVGISQAEKVRMKESQYQYYQRSHAWITTYAPFENPRYVITALVEHGGHGGEASAPVVRQLYYKMFQLGYFKDGNATAANLHAQ